MARWVPLLDGLVPLSNHPVALLLTYMIWMVKCSSPILLWKVWEFSILLSFPILLKEIWKPDYPLFTYTIFRASYLVCILFEKHLIFKQYKTLVLKSFSTISLDIGAHARDSFSKWESSQPYSQLFVAINHRILNKYCILGVCTGQAL